MAAANTFPDNVSNILEGAVHAAAITPVDANDLAFVTRGIRIAAAGALHVTMLGGEDMTYPSGALAAGVSHAIRATRIFATGTTATGICAEW